MIYGENFTYSTEEDENGVTRYYATTLTGERIEFSLDDVEEDINYHTDQLAKAMFIYDEVV